MRRRPCQAPAARPSPVRCWLPGLGRFMICFPSSWLWPSVSWGAGWVSVGGQETQGAGPPQQGSRHRPNAPTAGSGWGSGAGCAWGLGSCLLWEAEGSGASPAHTACSVLGPERGNGSGAALLGARSREAGAGRGPRPLDAWLGQLLRPGVYSSVSLHLVGTSFLGKWDRLKRKQGGIAEDPGGAGCSILLLGDGAQASLLRA